VSVSPRKYASGLLPQLASLAVPEAEAPFESAFQQIGHDVAAGVRPAPSASAAAGLLVFGPRGRVVGKSRFQLLFDLDEILGLGLEVTRMRPLEPRLEFARSPNEARAPKTAKNRVCRRRGATPIAVLDRVFAPVPRTEEPVGAAQKDQRRPASFVDVLAAPSNRQRGGGMSRRPETAPLIRLPGATRPSSEEPLHRSRRGATNDETTGWH
jgi:hypothetical protein